MNKPLTMIINEVKEGFAEICNKSALPISILDLIVQGLYSEIHSLAVNQAKEEERIYTESIKNNGINNNNYVSGDANETE
jgi:hypothetical protein